ncbi:MAG: triple tyrosine motif-containing protein [Flavobacteriaceae bacterium]|nr:triple tyrosine motif-containing protein [Flavobacteriaceae bacterium]
MNYFSSWFSVLFLVVGYVATGQIESTYIENFTKEDYKSANQNWGISVDSNNFVYVANNDGLLVFDGFRWEKYQLPNNTILRSVSVVKDTIYVGSYEEFGYFLQDDKGFLYYTSLSDKIDSSLLTNYEFWQIDKIGTNIYFKSFSKIFEWDGIKITELKGITTTAITAFVNKEKYIIGTLDKGLFVLDSSKDTFYPIIKSAFFYDKPISAITNIEENMLVGTINNGCFIETATGFVPWDTEVNGYLEKYQLNKINALEDGRLVFGTILNGLYITDSKGKILYHLNKPNGLQNNTVLGQTIDNNGNLWVGLDNGVDMIGLNIPVKYFTDKTGVLGSVYALHTENDLLLLGSNKGVFTLNENALSLIPNSQGHVWGIKKLNSNIFVSHNNGLFKLEGRKFERVQESLGGWGLIKIPEKKQYVQGLYNGIGIIIPDENPLSIHKVKGYTDPVKFVVFENPEILWVTHPYKGVHRLKLNKSLDSVISKENFADKGLITIYKAAVFDMDGRIVFPSAKGWQIYEPLSDSIVMYEELNKKLGAFKHSIIVNKDENGVWFDSNNHLVYLDKKSQSLWELPTRFYKERLVQNNVEIIRLTHGDWLLALDDGYAKIDLDILRTMKQHLELETIITRHIKSNDKYISLDVGFTGVKPGKNSIEIDVTTNQRIKVSGIKYRLSNYEKDWHITHSGSIKYSNIPSGDYTLEMVALGEQGNEVGTELKTSITVLPPWFLTNWAKLGYVLFLLFLIYSFYAINQFLLKKNQKKLRIKHVQEQRKIMHQKKIELEKKLIEIKSQQYKEELIHKEKELANTAISILRNKETLKQIKMEFVAKKDSFTDVFSYKRLIKKLDKSIESDEASELFETNFDAVHEDFLKKLIEKHPKLTAKDLKLCAMLRMNLTNKEIAPLLNITYRSVELQRYRLRKKLNLTTKEDLIKYLLQF